MIPLLFYVQKVGIGASREVILAELVAHREALDGTLTASELY